MRPQVDAVSIKFEATPFVDDVVSHFAECDALPWAIKDHLYFDRFLTQKREHSRARLAPERQRPRQTELQQVTSKMTLEHFDGTGRVTA